MDHDVDLHSVFRSKFGNSSNLFIVGNSPRMTWSLVVSSGSDFQVLEDSVGRLEYVCGVEVDIPEGFGCDISSCMQRTSIRCDDEVELNKTS